MTTRLSAQDKVILLKLARQAIQRAVNGMEPQTICVEDFSPALQDFGCSFVTLTIGGQLRGCIGALEPYLPLVQDVCEHAVSAAMEDYRFAPVKPVEMNQLEIEISHLSTPQPLDYGSPEELLSRLRPGIDGVILRMSIVGPPFCHRCGKKSLRLKIFSTNYAEKWARRDLFGGKRDCKFLFIRWKNSMKRLFHKNTPLANKFAGGVFLTQLSPELEAAK